MHEPASHESQAISSIECQGLALYIQGAETGYTPHPLHSVQPHSCRSESKHSDRMLVISIRLGVPHFAWGKFFKLLM